MKYRIVNVFFIPGANGVTIAVQPMGLPPHLGSNVYDLFTTQRALAARGGDADADTKPLEQLAWGDQPCVDEAVAQLSMPGEAAEVLTYAQAEAYLASLVPPAPEAA